MITIIVVDQEEYDVMREFAGNYVCTQTPFTVCGKYEPNTCHKCYRDRHVKCGIRVIRVDNDNPDEL